ncbi:hypothetical protein BH11PSE11_BH11PSE11_00330 [soil metagenome]
MRHDSHSPVFSQSRVSRLRSHSRSGIHFKVAWAAAILLLVLCLLPKPVAAHDFTVIECKEGGDFIRNAALARDGGMSETVFIDRIRDDLDVIKSFPPHLRWFVQDDDDAGFLMTAAVRVFQRPQKPLIHQTEFLKACLGRTNVGAKDFDWL